MTFKQLIDKYRFDDIIPELMELWDKGNLYLFRQAYDILRKLQPQESEDCYVIEVSRVKGEMESYNRVANLSGWDWAENLNWEIVVANECILTERQLLALCLWERTFYGFSPEQEQSYFEVDEDKAIEPGEMGRRKELVSDICSKYAACSPSDLEFILTDQELMYYTFDGASDSASGDINYIVESIVSYSNLPEAKDVDHCVALVCSPRNDDFSASDFSKLSQAITTKIGCNEPLIHKRVSPDRNHVTVTLLYL